MYNVILSCSSMKFLYLVCFCISYIHLVTGNRDKDERISKFLKDLEEKANEMLDENDICNEVNLEKYLVFDTMDTIKVFFGLSNVNFKNCFTFFNVSLEKKKRAIRYTMIPYKYDEKQEVLYEFKNVSCGAYEVVVQPCRSNLWCLIVKFRYPRVINVTSDCFRSLPHSKFIPDQNVGTEKIKIASGLTITLLFVISGFIYYYYFQIRKKKRKVGEKNNIDMWKYSEVASSNGERVPAKSVIVYILHSYDENNVIKSNVDDLKDFLEQSSCFHSVKTINSELAIILRNVSDWLNTVLEEKREDGLMQKIVLIDSAVPGEEDIIENEIFYEFIDIRSNDRSRCLTGYDNLFVVQFDNTHVCSEKVRNMVTGHRFCIRDQLIDLYINLCSCSECESINNDFLKRKFKTLILRHTFRHLGMIPSL